MFKNLIKKLKSKNKKNQGVFTMSPNNNVWTNKVDIENHVAFFGTTGKGKSSFPDREEIERMEKEKHKEKMNKILNNF